MGRPPHPRVGRQHGPPGGLGLENHGSNLGVEARIGSTREGMSSNPPTCRSEALTVELRQQLERLERPSPREMVKAARLLRRAQSACESTSKEAGLLEQRLAILAPSSSWAPVRTIGNLQRPEADIFEERLRSLVREEIQVQLQELEKTIEEQLKTLAETDARIVRELRRLQQGRFTPPGPLAT